MCGKLTPSHLGRRRAVGVDTCSRLILAFRTPLPLYLVQSVAGVHRVLGVCQPLLRGVDCWLAGLRVRACISIL